MRVKSVSLQALEEFQYESCGVLDVHAVRLPFGILGLLAQALGGSSRAERILDVLGRWNAGAGEHRPLCLVSSCAAAFNRKAGPAAFVIAVPLRDDPTKSLIGGICAACAAKRSDEELILLLRQYWRDLRFIDAPLGLGHA